ncbi:MAG TPA: zinc metallopeptidase [Kouleothrix sp.]|uniref:zinc metallopeptidase n=1 Tax=Kouleothrix sp. TaxID=2779161 RepID=UPI002C7C0775|nr:zinc metallopeptidase [Kouleothrix sp.]HRC75265.1 zinc metallopeptidase [Kouleothrix sp.]
MPFLFNFQYMIFMLPAIALALFAQWKVSSTYKKYSQVRNLQGLTGADVARTLMRNEGLEYVQVEMIPGDLTDHYDPRGKVMRLSAGSAQTPSVAAMAVVAHELGHALQDKQGYFWLQLRSGIVGAANIGSSFGTILVFIGLMLGAAAGRGGTIGFTIALAGLVLMSAAVVFSLVTLPVELNASARAREMLMRAGLVTTTEADGVRAMLNAAALTYIAGAAQAVMQLLYFASLILGGRRR